MKQADLSYRQARLLSLTLIALVSVVLTIVITVVLQGSIPQSTLVYYLFNYEYEKVGIDLYGGILPLIACLWLAPALRRSRRKRVFWAFLALTAAVPTLAFASFAGPGGTSIGVTGGEAAIVLGGLYGAVYGMLRGIWATSLVGAGESFFIGAAGLFASDVILTFSGQIEAPFGAVIWGGGGTHDLVLWFGIYMAIGFTAYRLLEQHLGLLRFFRRSVPSEPSSS